MDIFNEAHYRESEYNTRRHFLKNCISGMGALTLGSMLGGDLFANNLPARGPNPTFFAQSKACNLFAYGRGTIAIGAF